MADQSDVETALVALVSAALYPNGTGADSVPGMPCRIYRGWPNPTALDADLAAGRINVTIFAGEAATELTTRYPEEWEVSPVVPTLTATVSGISVAFAGSADAGQAAGLLVDGKPYAYRVVANDTPALVAANLAALVRADRIVTLSGAILTIPGAGDLLARVVADAPAMREIRRQRQNFRLTCWCPTPASRDAAAVAIDSAFAAMNFITLADTSVARIRYAASTVFDQSQDASLYRRDLLYNVEYATTVVASQTSMLFGALALNSQNLTA